MVDPQIITLTAAGISPSIRLDVSRFRDGVGLVIGISPQGSAIYTVECTGDRADVDDSVKLWVALPLLTNKNAATTSNLEFPVTALRLNAAAVSGTLQLAVICAG